MMKLKTILLLLSLLIASTGSIVTLFYLSNHTEHTGFNRQFPPHAVEYVLGIDLKYNSYYIAGASKNNIYLGNYTAPLKVIETDFNLSATSIHLIKLPAKTTLKLTAKLHVDSTSFYLTEGITPLFLCGNLKNFSIAKHSTEIEYFTDAIPIGQNSLAIRALYKQSNTYVLAKQTIKPLKIKTLDSLLKKQIDGFFDVDGQFQFDPERKQLIYLYYYRNQFLNLDTNMKLLYTGTTIDTTSRAKISMSTISSSNKYTMSSPPLVVNKNCAVYGNKLFVHSNLKADNESMEMFKSSDVIDVYDLSKKGKYLFSFYIFPHGNKRLTSFNVKGNLFIAIHDHYLVKYELARKYFKD